MHDIALQALLYILHATAKSICLLCRHVCPVSADYALALVAIPYVTERYDVLNLDTSLLHQDTVDLLSGILSKYTIGLSTLQKLTSGKLGLDYTWWCPEYGFSPRTKPSISQNARGVWLMQELRSDVKNTLLTVSIQLKQPSLILKTSSISNYSCRNVYLWFLLPSSW